MKKSLKTQLVFLLLILFGTSIAFRIWKHIEISGISNFDECVANNHPVSEIYPPQCNTPDGRTFTQDIGNIIEYIDLIRLDSPKPNTIVKSPLNIIGKARGNWFWEANSEAELLDGTGKSIAFGHVLAKGEWMTEEFVPFEGVLTFSIPETTSGKLILRNDNPSGLPENNKELIIPVKF